MACKIVIKNWYTQPFSHLVSEEYDNKSFNHPRHADGISFDNLFA